LPAFQGTLHIVFVVVIVTLRPYSVVAKRIDCCCLSVCPPVCPVPDPNESRMEGRRKMNIGSKEAHNTSDQWLHLKVERSKVKVTRPINAVTESQACHRNGKAYELGTWCMNGVLRPASLSRAVTSRLKALGVAVQVTTCRGRGHIVAHCRPHSLLLSTRRLCFHQLCLFVCLFVC